MDVVGVDFVNFVIVVLKNVINGIIFGVFEVEFSVFNVIYRVVGKLMFKKLGFVIILCFIFLRVRWKGDV